MGTDYREWEAARLEHARESAPPAPPIMPAKWLQHLAHMPAHFPSTCASEACQQALNILKGFDDDTIRSAAFQMVQTFEWVGDEEEYDTPAGSVFLRYVLSGPLQYLEYCSHVLPPSDIVDGELGDKADGDTLYATLAIALFSQALEHKSHPDLYADRISTACYASCMALHHREMREIRERFSLQTETEKSAASKVGNEARHQRDRAAKALVLKWWNEGDYAKFCAKSDAAAPDHYPAALEAAGLSKGVKPFRPSTVATWLVEGRDAEGKAKK